MAVIVVAGVVNVETSLPVEDLPVPYAPVRYVRGQLHSRASGVGFNVAAALAALGGEVRLATYLGDDALGALARQELAGRRLTGPGVLVTSVTAQSVVQTASDGRRMVFTDVKHLPEETYPAGVFDRLLNGADLAAISTIGFARSLLPMARAHGVPVAVDLQAIESLDDCYLQDWLDCADIVFCSDERLPTSAAEGAGALLDRCANAGLVVVGRGPAGCLLQVRGEPPQPVPAVAPRAVASTVGAGDALFAGFLDGHLRGLDPLAAVERAVLFAGWKIGSIGGGEGFLTGPELDQ
jgi:sugar/nucleoside kinase (ribokinase family)